MEAKILSIANRKGGVGKSTITTLLASAIAIDKKKKVCIVDCDSQKSITKYREMESGAFPDEKIPYTIEPLPFKFLHDFLQYNKSKYDYIFIDIPRITDNEEGNQLLQILGFCDGILIPFLGGVYESLSTKDFIKAIQVLANYKKSVSIDFEFYGVLNRKSRKKENQETIDFLKSEGLEVFDTSLNNLKLFSSPSTLFSVFEDAEGRRRFTKFFKEFCTKFNVK
jgi:chromosome partitioning protein